MNTLKGFRTKISALFAGLPIGAISLAEIFESPIVADFIQSNPVFSLCYGAVSYLSTHYFRDQATKADVPQEKEPGVTLDYEPKPETPELTGLEAELYNEINGEYER